MIFIKKNIFIENRKKIIIYSTIQLLGFSIDFIVFYILYEKIYSVILFANFFSKILSSCFCFILHRKITFKKKNAKNINISLIKYYGFVLINIPITSSLTFLFDFFFSSVFFAKIISEILYFIVGYFLSKKLIFN